MLIAGTRLAAAQSGLNIDHSLGSTKGWAVGYSKGLDGCLASATYVDQTTVWIGFGGQEGANAYVAFTNPNWRSIETGKKYEIQLRMGSQGRWRGNFVGLDRENEKGLLVAGLKSDFLYDFAKANGIGVVYQDKSITKLNLHGSQSALEAVLECQKERNRIAANEAGKSGTPEKPSGKSVSMGTGFFVTAEGHILTNHHVVKGCPVVRVSLLGSESYEGRVLATDEKNDLALVTTSLKPRSVPSIRPTVRVGEAVSVYGFPHQGFLATSGNFTLGNVTAAAGLGDDTSVVQISAPVHAGNSGGPLLDQYGNIIGVIVAKVSFRAMLEKHNDVPQNINFAIKSAIALNFLESNGSRPRVSPNTTPVEPADLAEQAKAFTVLIVCVQ